MIYTNGLTEQLNDNYKERLNILAVIEDIRQHHLVRDYAQFYLTKNGELKSMVKDDSSLTEAARLQVEGRVAKIHSLIENYNETYKKIRKIIAQLPPEQALYVFKECAKESIRLYDEVNDDLVKEMKKYNAIAPDFQGKVDVSKLKNLPWSKKVTLTILQQYIDYEIAFYKSFEEQINNTKSK